MTTQQKMEIALKEECQKHNIPVPDDQTAEKLVKLMIEVWGKGR